MLFQQQSIRTAGLDFVGSLIHCPGLGMTPFLKKSKQESSRIFGTVEDLTKVIGP